MLTGNSFAFEWEVRLMEGLQNSLGPGAISVISFFSAFGEELLLVLILGFLYWGCDKKMGKAVGLNVLMGLIWNPMIKNVFLRRRPYFDHENIKILRVVDQNADPYDIAAQGFSFPSGHSTNTVIAFGSLAVYKKRVVLFKVLAVVLPLLVGASRVILGVHYPTDVLAGWLLGAIVLVLVSWLQFKVKNKWVLRVILLAVSLPGILYCRTSDYYTSLGMLAGMVLAQPFESRFVRFQSTKVVWKCVLRVAGGVAIYFGANILLKLPFSSAFLESGTLAALGIRTLRYAIIIFLLMGVYPMLFSRRESETAHSV